MSQLLRKEFRLASHPAAVLFLGLSAMMLIPNYPLTVTFFYPCLGAFFICLSGRENRDIYYSALLPVRKTQLVTARMLHVCLLQLGQVLLCLPFCFLRSSLYPPQGNAVGLDANLALLGFGLMEMGLFNLVFFPRYYKDPNKVGTPFLMGSVAVFLWIGFAEAVPHFVPFVRNRLDSPLLEHVPEKLLCFLVGAAVYAALTLTAAKLSRQRFETLDL